MATGAQLSAIKRPKWLHITMGVVLIVVAVALTVGWQILGQAEPQLRPLPAPCAGSSTSSGPCSSCSSSRASCSS